MKLANFPRFWTTRGVSIRKAMLETGLIAKGIAGVVYAFWSRFSRAQTMWQVFLAQYGILNLRRLGFLPDYHLKVVLAQNWH